MQEDIVGDTMKDTLGYVNQECHYEFVQKWNIPKLFTIAVLVGI